MPFQCCQDPLGWGSALGCSSYCQLLRAHHLNRALPDWTARPTVPWKEIQDIQRLVKLAACRMQALSLESLRLHWSHVDGLVQERCNSIANALELHLSCTNPSLCLHAGTTLKPQTACVFKEDTGTTLNPQSALITACVYTQDTGHRH